MWLAGNLKVEVTNNLRNLYGPGGMAHPGGGDDDDEDDDDDDDDDDDGGEKEDLKATPSYQPRKRQHH